MRINEWNQRNQNAAKMNGSGGVQGKGNTKKLGDISTKSCKIKPEEDSFRSSLQKSMVQEEAMKAQVKKAEAAGREGSHCGSWKGKPASRGWRISMPVWKEMR